MLRLREAARDVSLGVVASGLARAGHRHASASAPRTWERLSAPARVSWFPARERVQALVEPAHDEPLRPNGAITLTFSRPTAKALGSAMPAITPDVPGHWRQLDTHTLSFRPTGLGFPLGSHVEVRLPSAVDLVARPPADARTRRSPGRCSTARSSGSTSCSPRPATSRSTGARPATRSPARPQRAARRGRRPARRPLQLAVRGHDAEGAARGSGARSSGTRSRAAP